MGQQQNKTVETDESVFDFINTVTDETKRNDSLRLVELMEAETGIEPRMWGTGIIGFGSYHYRYESGREGDAPLIGFSPRKNELSLYLALNQANREELLPIFGKHKTSKACIYVKKLSDIDECILQKMIRASMKNMQEKYPSI